MHAPIIKIQYQNKHLLNLFHLETFSFININLFNYIICCLTLNSENIFCVTRNILDYKNIQGENYDT